MDKSLLKISGIIAIVFGILACLTLVGAIVGVPLIIGGAKMKEYAEVPLLAKPNAGLPVLQDGVTVYPMLPEEFASR